MDSAHRFLPAKGEKTTFKCYLGPQWDVLS